MLNVLQSCIETVLNNENPKLEIDFSFHKNVIFYKNSISNQWRKDSLSNRGVSQEWLAVRVKNRDYSLTPYTEIHPN